MYWYSSAKFGCQIVKFLTYFVHVDKSPHKTCSDLRSFNYLRLITSLSLPPKVYVLSVYTL